jgi:sugar lactone lactonase YvrE
LWTSINPFFSYPYNLLMHVSIKGIPMRRNIILFTPLFLLVNLMAISLPQKVETKGGIRTIHNSKEGIWEKSPRLQLEKIREIGGLEAENDEVAFYMPLDMALDAEGNLYVLDTGNHRIQKFSPEANFLGTIGRKGQGPGEFNFPGSLDIDEQGNLIVASNFIKRIQVLDGAGQEIRGITITGDFSANLRVLGFDRYLSAVQRRPPMDRDDENTKGLDPLMQVMGKDGRVIKTFGEPRNYKHEMVNAHGNEVRFAVSPDGFIYVSFRFQNRIEKYSSEGDLIWRAERKLNYNADKPISKGKIERSGGSISITSPEMNRCCEALAVDGEGRIWVIAYARQLKDEERAGTSIRMSRSGSGSTISMAPSTHEDLPERSDALMLEVFDPEGILLQSFPLNQFADSIAIHGEHLYLLDKVRHMKVLVYRIANTS